MTLKEVNLDNSLEGMELEDRLSCITADLLEYENNSPFLDRLFSVNAGQWVEITSLCRGLDQIENQLQELRKLFTGELRVTWIDYPNAVCGSGYCLILFFVEALHWSNLALYNKQLFLSKRSRRVPTGLSG